MGKRAEYNEQGEKKCGTCGEFKPEESYYKSSKKGVFSQCKACVLKYHREKRKSKIY